MRKILAICNDNPAFLKNKILDLETATRYPGALWASRLVPLVQPLGFEVMTGDMALQAIMDRSVEAKNVWIVQEELSTFGNELASLGGRRQTLFCCESPIFAAKFYQEIPHVAPLFAHRILYVGALAKAGPGKNSILQFPSFANNTLGPMVPWENRKFLVMVVGNKYFRDVRPIWRTVLGTTRDFILRRQRTKIPAEVFQTQLHDRRLELIEHFGRMGKLDLFGPGWQKLEVLPWKWRRRLKKIILSLNPQKCGDKQELIAQYKFSCCLENVVYPGHMTEKLVDCLHARVLPIYLGPPDVLDFVPAECFIDLRNYANLKDLSDDLLSFTPERAEKMLQAGQDFLRSRKGFEFSFEGFAQRIVAGFDKSVLK